MYLDFVNLSFFYFPNPMLNDQSNIENDRTSSLGVKKGLTNRVSAYMTYQKSYFFEAELYVRARTTTFMNFVRE